MPTFRLTQRQPRAWPRISLIDDVDADDTRREQGGRLILINDLVILTSTLRTVVVRRVDPSTTHVECLCPARRQAGGSSLP